VIHKVLPVMTMKITIFWNASPHIEKSRGWERNTWKRREGVKTTKGFKPSHCVFNGYHTYYIICKPSNIQLICTVFTCILNLDLTFLDTKIWINILIHILHTQYIQSLRQLKILFILTLKRHVSAAVGHHQVFLLKLFHCNFYI
jgi:hypothetical protein